MEELFDILKELPPRIDQYGNQTWVDAAGHYHRINDKPAIIFKNGSKEWYIHGKLHRDNDKPAIICWNGDSIWYTKGHYIKHVK